MLRALLRPILGPIIRPLRAYLRQNSENQMRQRVLDATALTALNQHYLTLGTSAQLDFYQRYAKLFHQDRARAYALNALWRTRFAGRDFAVPLQGDWLWLDWDYALSLPVHDLDVKLGYQAFLEHTQAPELFLDVGANYGAHSLIFLKFGVRTLSFEPNTECHAYFTRLCIANDVQAELIKSAIGAHAGEITLAYPERETWLSTADPHVQADLRKNRTLIEVSVPMMTLDSMLAQCVGKRVLMKIDTEGFELEVLKGAEALLRDVQPYIYFEALPQTNHFAALSALLQSQGYTVVAASTHPFLPAESVLSADLRSLRSDNYLALPARRWR